MLKFFRAALPISLTLLSTLGASVSPANADGYWKKSFQIWEIRAEGLSYGDGCSASETDGKLNADSYSDNDAGLSVNSDADRIQGELKTKWHWEGTSPVPTQCQVGFRFSLAGVATATPYAGANCRGTVMSFYKFCSGGFGTYPPATTAVGVQSITIDAGQVEIRTSAYTENHTSAYNVSGHGVITAVASSSAQVVFEQPL